MHGMNSNKTYTSNETNIYTSYTNEVMPQHILHVICMKKHIILFVLNFFFILKSSMEKLILKIFWSLSLCSLLLLLVGFIFQLTQL